MCRYEAQKGECRLLVVGEEVREMEAGGIFAI
jgi:hypothetical protein